MSLVVKKPINLLDLPVDILKKIENYIRESSKLIFKCSLKNAVFGDYFININLNEWNDEITSDMDEN